MGLFHGGNERGGLGFTESGGESGMPFRFGGIGTVAHTFFADVADEHRYALREKRSCVVERSHGYNTAVYGWRPTDARGGGWRRARSAQAAQRRIHFGHNS